MEKNKYAELINCKTAEEVLQAALEWSSDLPKKEHLKKSAILEIHANIENQLKQIFWEILKQTVMFTETDDLYEKGKSELLKIIQRANFSNIYKYLQPGFSAFGVNDYKDVEKINELRNHVVHRDIRTAKYKNRNPFTNHDCLAQIFFDGWAVGAELDKYYEFVIDGPRFRFEKYRDFYNERKDKE